MRTTENHKIKVQALATSDITYSYAQRSKKQKRGTRRIRSAMSIFQKQLKGKKTSYKSQIDFFQKSLKQEDIFQYSTK